jgi:UDP-glucose 4-epimerase
MESSEDRPAAPVRTSLSSARVVVTGGLGFIGSNVVHRLAEHGASVVVIDALVPEHGGDIRNLDDLPKGAQVDVLVADIARDDVGEALAGADVVFNIAGQVSHHASMQRPMRDLDLNVRSHMGFLELLRRRAPGTTVVLTSTRQVYGRPKYLPVDEEHPTQPVDVNGIDKLACEQIHHLYGRQYDMGVVVLRLTNVYGPRQHLEREGLGFLPVFVRHALLGEDIVLFGDGSQERDCVYVDDVVDVLLMAATMRDATGDTFNLGHPDALTLREIAELTQRAAGGRGGVHTEPWDEELLRIDIGSFQGDFAKAKRLLGWAPRVSFADGIERTIRHYRDRSWSPSST